MTWGVLPLDQAVTAVWACLMRDPGGTIIMRWQHNEAPCDYGSKLWDPNARTCSHLDIVKSCGRLLGLVEAFGLDRELEVLAVPRGRPRWNIARDAVTGLWVRTETRESVERLERFRRPATIVLQEGDSARRVALWAVTTPHRVDQALRANRRLAHALGTPKKFADPDEFAFSPPGTFLRHGRKRPVPVTVASYTGRVYAPRELYGGLRDAPDPDAWRNGSQRV